MATNDQNVAYSKAISSKCQALPKKVHFYYDGGIIANGGTVKFFKIINIDIHRNYVNDYCESIIIDVLMGAGDFYKKIYPFADNLSCFIRKREMIENTTFFNYSGIHDEYKYKAFLIGNTTQGIDANNGTGPINDPDMGFVKASFQLIDQSSFDLKQVVFNGLLEMTDPSQALSMILSGTGEDYDVAGVNMVKPDVTEKRQIIIKRGTLVKDMAQYLQQEYGIYNFGIGSFLQEIETEKDGVRLLWWVYPLFNNARYNIEYFKLTVVFIQPQHDIPHSSRTYYVDNGNITIISSSNNEITNNQNTAQLNQGTGVQVINPFENRSTNTDDVAPNKTTIDGTTGVSTFTSVDRKDKYKNTVSVYGDVANTARLVSSVVGNNGTYVTVTWRYANVEILQPGMPVKLVYLDGNLKELYGTLHEYHAISSLQSQTLTEAPFMSIVQMKIYVTGG